MRSAVSNAITCGKALIAAKQQCRHGEWSAWLEKNFEHSHSSANAYMRIANSQSTANLDNASSISEALNLLAQTDSDAEDESPPDTATSVPEYR